MGTWTEGPVGDPPKLKTVITQLRIGLRILKVPVCPNLHAKKVKPPTLTPSRRTLSKGPFLSGVVETGDGTRDGGRGVLFEHPTDPEQSSDVSESERKGE